MNYTVNYILDAIINNKNKNFECIVEIGQLDYLIPTLTPILLDSIIGEIQEERYNYMKIILVIYLIF